MRVATAVVLILFAGCVDPAAREDGLLPPAPDGPPAAVIVPVVEVLDLEGQPARQFMLGQSVVVDPTATPTANLSSLSLSWTEEGDMVRGGGHWEYGPLDAFLITPRSEGTLKLRVSTVSETGHRHTESIFIGVNVHESRNHSLATAHPLDPPEPCRPSRGLMGEEASVQEVFRARPVPLPGGRATMGVRTNAGVEAAWCQGDEPMETTLEGDWLRVHMPSEPWPEAELWLANFDAEHVTAEIHRTYPGSPLPS